MSRRHLTEPNDHPDSAEPAEDQADPDQPGPQWQDRLRGHGYRLTPQRELVLRAVDELGHATPDEILAEVRQQSAAVNVSTVYRNLEVLEEIGLVRHVHLSDRTPTYHSNQGHAHFHLVCRNCHRVTSVDPDMAATFATALRHQQGFDADLGHLTVHGRCVQCPEPGRSSEAGGSDG
ncbi:MAG: Fur family transcriptional regulator [Nocardioides sp.]